MIDCTNFVSQNLQSIIDQERMLELSIISRGKPVAYPAKVLDSNYILIPVYQKKKRKKNVLCIFATPLHLKVET